jgi:DNA-binding CsgD family transcriptional regulator
VAGGWACPQIQSTSWGPESAGSLSLGNASFTSGTNRRGPRHAPHASTGPGAHPSSASERRGYPAANRPGLLAPPGPVRGGIPGPGGKRRGRGAGSFHSPLDAADRAEGSGVLQSLPLYHGPARRHRRTKALRQTSHPGLQAAAADAIAALPPRRREVFRLARLDGLSYREIAEVMGLSPQTVANQMSRALTELHEALDGLFREGSPDAPQPYPGQSRAEEPAAEPMVSEADSDRVSHEGGATE